jgi:NADPH:quinone reductase-like Zn-dependent oxidoreductase
VGRIVKALALSAYVGQKLVPLAAKRSKERLAALTDLIEAGKVTPVIDRTYPLSEVPEAIRYVGEGHAQGKIVITV